MHPCSLRPAKRNTLLSEDFMRRLQRPVPALVSGVLATLVLWAAPSSAQTWPQRPVKFVVTLGPGSGVDIGSRLFADRLSARWGQPVVIENRPGGDGLVAINSFVLAKDDHVLLMSPTSSFTAHPFLHENLPYKPSDLLPIARISNTVVSIGVPASMDIKSLDELFARVRAQPGKLNWAGITGALDFLFEGFLKGNGLEMAKVPYRNPVEAANDLAEGRVQVVEAAYAIVRPQVQAGKIRVLAVVNTVRSPAAPDVPTVKEAGYPALTVDGLVGLFGPAGMPTALRERIVADIRAAANDPIIADRLTATGQILNIGGPAEFEKSIDEQRAEVAKMAKTLGVAAKQ
jgi:tripartite-type tricarboxylate transporter receptor subunit TctC